MTQFAILAHKKTRFTSDLREPVSKSKSLPFTFPPYTNMIDNYIPPHSKFQLKVDRQVIRIEEKSVALYEELIRR